MNESYYAGAAAALRQAGVLPPTGSTKQAGLVIPLTLVGGALGGLGGAIGVGGSDASGENRLRGALRGAGIGALAGATGGVAATGLSGISAVHGLAGLASGTMGTIGKNPELLTSAGRSLGASALLGTGAIGAAAGGVGAAPFLGYRQGRDERSVVQKIRERLGL